MKPLQIKLHIPEFVPSSKSQEMVWSPTTGSRPRRKSDDISSTEIGVSTGATKVKPPISPDVSSLQKAAPLPLALNHRENDLIAAPENSHRSPAKEFLTHSLGHNSRKSSPLPLTDISNRQRLPSPFPSSPRHFADRAHHHPLIQHTSQKSNLQPTGDVVGLPEIQGASPSSLQPPLKGYPSSLSLFVNPPSTHHNQHLGSAAGTLNTHYRLPLRPSQHHEAPRGPAFINQLDPLSFQPDINTYDPRIPPHHQRHILVGNQPNEEMLQIPAPGSMDPLTYWNLLYHRENTILSCLSAAGLLLTDSQAQYIAMMKQMRVSAAASQLPFRGNRGKIAWLKQLEKVLQEIWVLKPGQTGFSEEIIARKKDFESAVIAEIEAARMEKGKGR